MMMVVAILIGSSVVHVRIIMAKEFDVTDLAIRNISYIFLVLSNP
jgi:hypothetical protein